MGASVVVPGVDRSTLTPVVRRALGRNCAEVTGWTSERIAGGWATKDDAGGVYRLAGTALDRGATVSWSVILKATRSPGPGMDNWRREFFAYQSGFLDSLPGGLAAPRLFGSDDRPGEGTWLWLEDVADVAGPRWPIARYGLAARHLGRLNGQYLDGRPLPDHPWLSRGWLRTWIAGAERSYTVYPSVQDHPLVRRLWPSDVVDPGQRLWAERDVFLDALDRLPQTFCHLDAFRRNLLARRRADGGEDTVALDWAFSGLGAVGEDLAPLVAASVVFWEVAPVQLRELDEVVYESYLAGLRDGGWHGDERVVRFGYLTASALRYDTGGGHTAVMAPGFDARKRAQVETLVAHSHSLEEFFDCWAEVRRFLLGRMDEARALMLKLRLA